MSETLHRPTFACKKRQPPFNRKIGTVVVDIRMNLGIRGRENRRNGDNDQAVPYQLDGPANELNWVLEMLEGVGSYDDISRQAWIQLLNVVDREPEIRRWVVLGRVANVPLVNVDPEHLLRTGGRE
jgi:hypothetical protein